ncbi:hypothetical protein GH714_004430 [Hevea brasiliensis]|uniref:Uncharacterized protein n=1 Tax=Hevea brasiliensis TaxID=3981 RepID=A0A6A6KXI4_HEVBR|nr:hypothetical protein GH714_004430 [Hevea brasiliensis]
MAKGSRGRCRIASRQCRPAPYKLASCNHDEDLYNKKSSKSLDKKDWEDVTCSVCMECPHNAVLLLCSSHDKGCRPYMCATSFRYSNCLDQYRKAYTKVMSSSGTADNPILLSDSSWPVDKCEVTELACPLCRGQVKGWTVVEPAREYLNAKRRSCMQDDCSFAGTYKELRKHMRTAHPSARPREVDPILEQKWRRLERDREHDDVISTIGDGLNRRLRQSERPNRLTMDESAASIHHVSPVGGSNSSDDNDDSDDDNGDGGLSLVSRLRSHGRVLLGHSGRRHRHREDSGGKIDAERVADLLIPCYIIIINIVSQLASVLLV